MERSADLLLPRRVPARLVWETVWSKGFFLHVPNPHSHVSMQVLTGRCLERPPIAFLGEISAERTMWKWEAHSLERQPLQVWTEVRGENQQFALLQPGLDVLERKSDEFPAARLGRIIKIVICPSDAGKLRLPFAGQTSLLCSPSVGVKQQVLAGSYLQQDSSSLLYLVIKTSPWSLQEYCQSR